MSYLGESSHQRIGGIGRKGSGNASLLPDLNPDLSHVTVFIYFLP